MNHDEKEIRAKALRFLDGQHVQSVDFYTAIRGYLQEIPVSRIGLPYCKVGASPAIQVISGVQSQKSVLL